MKHKIVARAVILDISGENVTVDIGVNESGNLMLIGIGSVTYQMMEEELTLSRYKEYTGYMSDMEALDIVIDIVDCESDLCQALTNIQYKIANGEKII